MTSPSDMAAIKTGMAGVYERQAESWDMGRDTSLRERDWLTRLLTGLPLRARILDLGCGAGRPLAAYLCGLGHDVIGVDASHAMIRRARKNVPGATFHVMDMRAFTLNQTFDAILSWDAFFHLSPQEQRDCFPSLFDHLRPGGNLLLTVGYGEGEVAGTVANEPVYHGSLNPEEYRDILQAHGFANITYTPNDQTVLGRYVLLACGKATS